MSQPPDDRRRMPWEPEPPDASDQPTVPWAPPDSAQPPQAPAPPSGGGWVGGTPAPPLTPPSTPETPAADAPPATTDQPAATGPLLSSTPSAPAPVVGWQQPDRSAAPAPVDGYVIAGPWARLVAWFIDGLLVAIIPTVLSFLVIDWGPLVEAMVEQMENPSAVAPTTFLPTTVEALVVAVIGVGLSYLYFVGFWTGPWMATPGMRILRLRVGDEHRSGILSLSAATKRWLAMGAWLGLLAYVGPFSAIAGIGTQVLQIALFISVILNVRRQGLHDRIAGSLVIRERAGGDSVVIGCVVLIGLAVLFAIVAVLLFLGVMWPLMEPLIEDMRIPA